MTSADGQAPAAGSTADQVDPRRLDRVGAAAVNDPGWADARAALLGCCASRAWVERILIGRPYPDAEAVLAAGDAALAELSQTDIAEALAGHPRIGERAAGAGAADSAREQAGLAGAAPATLSALAEGNREYEERFGHVYLVCAAGRSAAELLDLLHERLGNDPVSERAVLRAELGKINRIRLSRLLEAAG